MQETGGTTEHTFATYLAKALMAKKGYRPGTVPEAQALRAHCDAVLTMADGVTLAIVGIVDRQADPSRRLASARKSWTELGMDCLHYAGRVGGRKLPVQITIVEVGAGPVAPGDKERLKALKHKSLFSKVLI